MKILLPFIIISISLLLSGCNLFKSKNQSNSTAPYSFISPSPTSNKADAVSKELLEDAIKSQLAQKYNKSLDTVNLVVNQELAEHASGAVNFSGEMGGALWFAAKTKGGWILVSDGQGPMQCELVEEHNFPTTMISECLNGDQIIKRSNQ